MSPDVVDFARALVEQACPKSVGRAKALLFAAARLGSFAVSIGLELRPEVVLRESVIERFIIVRTPQMSPAMRRTLRSNLRVAGGRDLPALDTGRLRVTWLATCAEMLGLGAFMEAAGITCSQRLGDLVAHLGAVEEGRAVSLLGAAS